MEAVYDCLQIFGKRETKTKKKKKNQKGYPHKKKEVKTKNLQDGEKMAILWRATPLMK
jgi:hypothetical protein